jgi:DEAD/DEAH box helicase domain-containing protein
MQDPVGTFDAIRDNFIRYVRTAFCIRNETLDKERKRILEDPDSMALYRIPWIEPIPRYQSTAIKFGDLALPDLEKEAQLHDLQLPGDFDEEVFTRFKELVSRGLFPADRPLYRHQFEMMVRAICGESLVITAGTGSGKTEAFLLPIFARLVLETSHNESWAADVDQSNPMYSLRDTWWNGRPNIRAGQRLGERKDRPAVRALIIYPMNALVEDQMSRLRKALDSGAYGKAPDSDTKEVHGARQWYAANLGQGQRIYFGRYNGSTPVPGHETEADGQPNSTKIGDLKKQLKDAQSTFAKARDYDRQHNPGNEDVRFFFPSVDGAEMRSRWDMQDAPPDILVTNFSMLSIMLMRDADKAIFDTTKAWLESDPENNVFHLVIDELHLYRGTAGTEVAYLVRLLLHRLGLETDSPQLRILASSASLEKEGAEGKKSSRFVKEFFGREGIGILSGSLETVPDLDESLNRQKFTALAKAWEDCAQDLKSGELQQSLADAYEGVAEAFGGGTKDGQGIEKLVNTLSDPELVPVISNRLLGAFKNEGRLLASSLDSFGRRIFGLNENHDRGEVLTAVKGLLIARASIEFWPDSKVDRRKDSLPSFRLHWFFRNLEGLWASPDPTDGGSDTPRENVGACPVGKLYPNNRTIVTPSGNRPLELLYCEQCGEVMLGGTKLVGDPHDLFDLSLLGGDPDLESVPDKPIVTLTQDKSHSDYGVFWPSHQQQPSSQCPELQAQNHLVRVKNAWGANAVIYEAAAVDGTDLPPNAVAGWSPCKLDGKTGQIYSDNEQRDGLIQGFLYRTCRVHNKSVLPLGDDAAIKYPAFPAVCPCCGEDYRFESQNGVYRLTGKKSPIRTFRTGFTKISQTFAKELFYALPTEGQGADDRKLIVFSDSREDAAKIANDIERFHFEDMMRDALYTELRITILGKSHLAIAFRDETKPSLLAESYEALFPEETLQIKEKAIRYNELKKLGEEHRNDDQQDEYERISQELRQAVKTGQSGSVPMDSLYQDQIHDHKNIPLLIKRLKNLGMNPAGLDGKFQTYSVSVQVTDKKTKKNKQKNVFAEWWRMFDFDPAEVFQEFHGEKGSLFDRAVLDGKGFRKMVQQNILRQVFGKLYFGFESSGLGYPCIRAEDSFLQKQISNQALNANGFDATSLREVCNTVVRLLGEKFQYGQIVRRFGDEYPFIDDNLVAETGVFREKRRLGGITRYCNKVASVYGIAAPGLKQSIHDVINSNQVTRWVLRPDALDLQLANDHDSIWKCESCQRVHLHRSAGVCSHCMEALPDVANDLCKTIWKDHYYANATARDRSPFRLHTEELTGQTDDQAERQRHFRNIVLEEDGEPRVKVIDLLSVTTTMEVGIDIGDLRAVMQANMPPERFNYQQRAGRGGRRGQSYSIVMTLCRQRSHDTIHFENPTAITTGKAPTPFLAMDHMDIARRIMAKGVLREAFVGIGVQWYDGPMTPPDSHGELGYAGNVDDDGNPVIGWGQRRHQIVEWLGNNHTWLNNLANVLSIGFVGSEVTQGALFTFAEQHLVGLIDQLASSTELSTYPGLAERLAEGALLPMFGMPSKVRVLYHGRDGKWGQEVPSIDRELDLAVTEFAPGAQKTKDKRIHKSAGICPDLYLLGGSLRGRSDQPFTYLAWMSRCSRCHFVKSQPMSGNIETRADCPNCFATANEGFMEFEVRTPAAFYTYELDGGADAREDGEIISPPAARLADGDGSDLKDVQGMNFKKQFRAEQRLFTLNDNRGELFHGRPVTDNNHTRGSNFTNDAIVPRWLACDANIAQAEQIGLVAPKTTNVLTFRLNDVPLGLEVSPIRPLPSGAGNQPDIFVRPGVKSALNSAAFLIRSVAADALDIDPEEFDICHIRLVSLGLDERGDERYSGEFVIADHLANGSGFTRWLDQNLADQVISEIIRAADDAFAGRPLTQDSHGEFLCKLFDDSHRQKCDWSCYSCLRNFRNMRFHPLLDWRLATSMIRMLANAGEQVGLDGNWDKVELAGWTQSSCKAIGDFVDNFQGATLPFERFDDAECPAFRFGDKAVVVRHPLWDTRNPEGIYAEARETAEQAVGEEGFLTVDSFDLIRRPSWVFQQLSKNSGVFKP